MWSSGAENHHHHNNNNNRVSSSSSKSSSTSSCPSPFSSSPLVPTPRRKTMEEVWKDISLTSLQDKPSREASKDNSFRGTILQDFLARPFKETAIVSVVNPPEIDVSFFPSIPQTPPPATVLSLNSGPEFQYFDAIGFQQHHPRNSHHPIRSSSYQCCENPTSSLSSSLISGPSPPTLFDVFRSNSSNKRMPESDNSNSSDRRHKRMIKNRESAARSRARKQAYTNELELEVAHLMEENAKLRKQQQQLCVTDSSAQFPPRHSLHRTSTAPF